MKERSLLHNSQHIRQVNRERRLDQDQEYKYHQLFTLFTQLIRWRRWKTLLLTALLGLSSLLIWSIAATPSQAHWADMSAAEIVVNPTTVEIHLTYPTGLTPFADRDQNGQLDPSEITRHQAELQTFLGQAIQLTNSNNQPGALTVAPQSSLPSPALPPSTRSPSLAQTAPRTHSTLQVTYTWPQPIQGLQIHYNLFLPGISTANCLATILQNQQLQTFVFTPDRRLFSLTPGLANPTARHTLLVILGAIAWGAMHALSPGHGKTLVGAYLVGSRATPQQAIFLGLTTTVTHTIGIFALGGLTLFASRYLLPNQLYPWMNLISGLLVIGIGCHLLWQRSQGRHHHAHHDHAHHHQPHSHPHSHSHYPNHSHSHHPHPPSHPHSTPWSNLLALGISGGLIPCPAALVLLLSSIALGQIALGLLLVLAFSLGLAGVLIGLGLLMVYAKPLFRRFPAPKGAIKLLPILSAIGIVVIGCGLSAQALSQL